MAFKRHETRKLQQRVLKAAASGNVKLLRSLVESHREYICKGDRKRERRAKKRRREKDESVDFKSSSRRSKKRFRGGKEARDMGQKKRKQVEESNSKSGSRESTDSESSDSQMSSTEYSDSDTEEKSRRKPSPSETLLGILNARDFQGLTPLHHACYAGSDRVVKYLISEGAGVHSRDMKGNGPLHIAAKMGRASLVALLQKAGADMDTVNDDGETPSDILAKNAEVKKVHSDYAEQQRWYSHLTDEMSDDEWWGDSFSEAPDPRDWESILETMAENSQARGVYSEDYFSRRYNLTQEKVRKKKKPEKTSKDKAKAAYVDEKSSYPEEVNLQKDTTLGNTRSYDQRWQIFSKSYNLCLSYADVPFPVPEGEDKTLAQVLLQGVGRSLHRDALRKEILKWHPDKFLQKWGPKLQGPDHQRIVARVNEISQALNVLYKELAS